MQGLIGKKVGMTRVVDQDSGEMTPVTIIQADGNVVLQQKTVENDGYSSVQLGFEKTKEKSLSKAEVSHAKKYGAEAVRHIKEFDLDEGEEPPHGPNDTTRHGFE